MVWMSACLSAAGSVCLALVVSAGAVEAGPRRNPPPADAIFEQPLEASGCYYYRGRQWCGRYCYTEVNGKRYCQRWKRDAHPQAELELLPVK